MDFNRITELGMEKVAANPNVAGLLPGGQKQGLSKKQLAKLLAGGAAAGGAAVAGTKKYKNMSDDKKKSLKDQIKYRGQGALRGGAQGAISGGVAGALMDRATGSKTNLKQLAALTGGANALMGAINPQKTNVDASRNLKDPKEKQASAEELYIDGLQKIASVTGIEPEVLDEAIGVYNEEMTKEAEVNNFLDSISEEEAGEILKEAAQSSPELKGKISELEEQEENEDLGNLVSTIEGMSDEEAKKLLEEIE